MASVSPLATFYYQTLGLQRNINQNQNLLDRTIERLNTGLRVNRAADDPFGITQAKRVQTQQISNRQASSNTAQAINLFATAETGAKGIQNNLNRMRELILQSLNDTATDSDRTQIQKEIDKLVQDTDQIARSTLFNTRQLLDGSLGNFRLTQNANSVLSQNKTLTDSAGNSLSFLTGNPTVSNQIENYDLVQFQLFDNGSGGYGLNISTASGGVVLSYNDVLSAPTSLNVPVGGSTVNFERAAYVNTPIYSREALTNTELNDTLDNLVSAGRLSPVSFGSLSLNVGSQSFGSFYNVTGTSSIQSLLNSVNSLSPGLSASYNTSTGLISVNYSEQVTETTSLTTPYISAGTTTGVGGPYNSFALLPSAPQGPAYRDPTAFLPATGFNLNSPQSGFPSLPGSLNTALSFSGSDSSFLNIFGLSDSSNNGLVSGYTSRFYGEALATGNPGEYVNRTQVSIQNVSASQDLSGSNTGLTASDLNTTFEVLNTAIVSSSTFAAGNFTIDFGSNGIFDYQSATGAAFDPNTNSIQDILTAINNFKPGFVTASFDSAQGELSISNTPAPVTAAKITNPGLNIGGTLAVDYGSNGNANIVLTNATTIQDVINSLSSSGVTVTYNETADTLNFTNTANGPIPTSDTKVNNPPLQAGTFSLDFGDGRVFNYNFDPNTTTIDSFQTALNSWGTSRGVSSGYDSNTDQFTITNAAPAVVTSVSQFSDTQGLQLRISGDIEGVAALVGPMTSTSFVIDLGLVKNQSIDQIVATINAQTDVPLGNMFGTSAIDLEADFSGDKLYIRGRFGGGNIYTDAYISVEDYGTVGTSFGSLFNLSGNAIVPGSPRMPFDTMYQVESTANVGVGSNTTTALGDIFATTTTTPGSNQILVGDGGTGLASFFRLSSVGNTGSGTLQSAVSAGDIDNGPFTGHVLDIDSADFTSTSLQTLTTQQITTGATAAGNNQIIFSDTSGLFNLFKLSNSNSNVGALNQAYIQSTGSSAAIDNGPQSDPLDVNGTDISGTALNTLVQNNIPIGTPANTINFGGALGANIADFFNLNPSNPSTGSGTQSLLSAPEIDNRSVDSSLQIQVSDLTRSLTSLYTPKLGPVSGPLVLDGNTVFTIDPTLHTLNDVITAINGFAGPSNKTYSASLSAGGALQIRVNDSETLSAPGSAAPLDPNGATPQVNGNQITLDTASYLVGGPPPNSYPTFSTSQPPAPYQFTDPVAPSGISSISFSGSSNLFTILELNNVSSGSATALGSPEYRGTYTQSDAITYALLGEKRQVYSDSEVSTSTQAFGIKTTLPNLSGVPTNGIVAEVALSPTITTKPGQGLTFQVGPNEGNTLNLNISGLSAELLNLEGLSLFKNGDSNSLARLRANNALQIVDQALERSQQTLGQIGVGISILDTQLNQNEEQNLILSQSLSDIQDANIEAEIGNLTKAQINVQVGAALLADNAANTRDLYDVLFDYNRDPQDLFRRFLQG